MPLDIKSLLLAATAMLMTTQALAQTVSQPADPYAGDGGVTPFYTYTGHLPDRPGVMLRTEAMAGDRTLSDASRGERILYSSTDFQHPGKRIYVSGMVYFPKGAPPEGGWPIIAWAHGTTGTADVCAPSFMANKGGRDEYLNSWLKAGYAVVASDYQGLGTPGSHPYMQYRAEGVSTLDAVRAALAAYPELQNRVVTVGQSQGTGGALGAAYLAPSYAPDVHIKGTVATGLVVRVKDTGTAKLMAPGPLYADDWYGNSAFEVLFVMGTARSTDPEGINPRDYISDAGWPLYELGGKACFRDVVGKAMELKITMADFYKAPIDKLEKIVDDTSMFPDADIRTPVFVGTGLEDMMALVPKQYNFTAAMCAKGTPVDWRFYPGEDHGSTVMASLKDSMPFVDAVMHDRPAPNRCDILTPPELPPYKAQK